MENENIKEIELDNLNKLTKEQLESTLELYKSSADMETYVKIPFGLIFLVFIVHNVFIAGKSYPLKTYNTIMNTELTIAGIIILVVFIIAGIAISKTGKLKGEISEYSKRYHIKKQVLAEEFSLLAVQMYGGRGIKIK